MPNWRELNLQFEPYVPADGSRATQVFVRQTTTFRAEDLGKRTPAIGRERQSHFLSQVQRIAHSIGSRRLPIFVSFRGDRRRMDQGCIGHAVAAGILRRPSNGVSGYVDEVELAR